MLKGIKRLIVTTGVLACGGYVVYHFVLSDTAKNAMKFAYNAIKESYSVISNTLDDALGLVVKEEDIQNIESSTRKQWENIGF